ncbi:beta-ketoacyl synthase N-terminal-like domain-containing protein [Spongiimicrobium sp. 3-5]|uniref:beta-ketoacyl synthase N-terminal-like domain-containing protein n=1 Tax=Spongiimicrobium sp. 3-5 TaxID=3332596 RepID=UPI003980E108
MNLPISITSISSISPLGSTLNDTWENYCDPKHHFSKMDIENGEIWISVLAKTAKTEIDLLRSSEPKYRQLDHTVLYAMLASRKAVASAEWQAKDNFGINIGSSRGATLLFEKYHKEFLAKQTTHTLASPTTTLGNIASWVAHDLQTKGPEISHSITCSTALHALLNGVAWINSGMADKFLVGGSEASLTPFTIAQMQALKIYSREQGEYPCRAMDLEKKENTMVLGEGAAIACLEQGTKKNAMAIIAGSGYATEPLEHSISISTDAQCFQRSMKMALGSTEPNEVDVIVMHAPGTIKGDMSEMEAIKKIFGAQAPALTTNKWKIGHTFGASGMFSVEMAILMLQQQRFIPVPFIEYTNTPKKINKVMVNAVGFGGNAVSILLKRPD